MLNNKKIEELIENSKYSKTDVYRAVGISRASLYNILGGKTAPSVYTIEKIADLFQIPIDCLFDRSVEITGYHIGHKDNGNSNNISGDIALNECRKEIEYLTRLLEEKERTINILLDKHNKQK